MPTIGEKFECGHVIRTQVGVDPKPVEVTEEKGLCFWCECKKQEQHALHEWAEKQRRS